MATNNQTPLLEVRNLKTYFYTEDGVVRAVDGVDFYVNSGEVLGIVGESGCGKSVTSLSIMRLISQPDREIAFQVETLVPIAQARGGQGGQFHLKARLEPAAEG